MIRFPPQVLPVGVAASVIAATGCDRTDTTPLAPAVTIRDSADIEIVENDAPSWGEGDSWTVATEPEIVIGGYRGAGETPDSSHLVWSVADVAPLSDGRVAVLSSREKKLLLFERTGEFARSIGREGRGPGEFGHPLHLQVLPGDTLVVWDFMLGPISYFDPSGQLLRDWRIDVGALFATVRRVSERVPESVFLPLGDGSFIVQTFLSPVDSPLPVGVPFRSPIEFLRIDSSYTVHSLGQWARREVVLQEGLTTLVPFAFGVHLAAGVGPPSVYITNSDQYEVQRFSTTGTLSRIIRRTADPIPITAEDIEEWKAGFSLPWKWELWDEAMAKLPPREFRPPVVGLLVDSEGYLWVADRKDRARSEWSVFDPAGRWLGTLAIPLEHVEWIGEDLILGVNTDPDTGVEVVQGYRLSR